DFQGQSPLHIAVNLGMHEMVQELIIQGAHLDPLDNEEATPLMYALQLGRVGIAALLVRSGASLQRQRSDGASPLHLCLHSLHRHMQRAEESAKSWTSLHILVLTLIACEAPLNIQDQRGDTPLHLCGRLPYGKSLLWLVMLKSGARTGVRNMDGEAPYFSFNHQRLDKMRESAEQDAARCLSVIGAPYFMPKALGKWMYCRVARKLEKHGLVNRLLAYSKVHGLKAGDDVTELLDPR
ncbi:MAG: ankyrin repeat domain-containing protein, partial [Chlamydiia bacterium]|nr:ankyrin repeat domain-containing protein [Chlamydiia bacterium]